MDTHDLRRRLHFETQKRNFTCIPRTRHARSPQKVALWNQKSQLYLHSAHSTRTISADGCTSKSKKAISPAFRALDTRDLRRALHFEIRNRNFTCIPRTRHARSPQTVALRNQKRQFHLHSAHSTRAISAEGSHFETILQKYCACHEIMTRGHTKCCTGHAKTSSSSSSKNATPLRNWALRPQNIGSMVRIPCACHVKRNPSNDTRLPTFWQRPRNTAPATIFTMCPIPCTCHVNSRFWPP